MASSNNQKIKTEITQVIKENDSNNVLQLETNEDEYNINVAYENDGHAVYVQQGQYVIPVGGHAVVLQDDQGDFEYIINNIVTDEELQNANENEQEGGQSVIYYTSDFADQSQIFEEDGGNTSETTDGIDESIVEETGMHAVIPLSKRIKLEQNYIDDYQNNQESYGVANNFIQVQEEVDSDKIIITPEAEHGQQSQQYQYAILKNGKLHLQTLDFVDATADSHQFANIEDKDQHQQLQEQLEAFQQSISMDDTVLSTSTVNLDKITGKNLITGQTVTLDSYFDKLQRRLSTADVAVDQCFSYNVNKKQPTRRSDSCKNQGSTSNDSTSTAPVGGNFINKKIVVGKTSNGKKIVGKILSVHMTTSSDSTTEQDETLREPTKETMLPLVPPKKITNPDAKAVAVVKSVKTEPEITDWNNAIQETQESYPQIIIKKQIVTRENFDYNIGKTLAGLMDLETVQRRLKNKNLVVKLVEKHYDHNTDAFNKTVSYVYGHMEAIQSQWAFVLHNENNRATENTAEDDSESAEMGDVYTSKENIPNSTKKPCASDNEEIDNDSDEIKDVSLEIEDDLWVKYNETASLTIIVTVDKSGKKSTRVNLSPQQPDSRCPVCSKEFKAPLQMRKHLNNVHLCEKSAKCELCGKNFANQTVLQRHQKIHTGERWYQCLKCSKSFNTAGGLKRHLTVHDPSLRPLECSVCLQRFTDESSLRKHLLIHTGIRAYACEVCNRAFVNQSDLNFHRRIHDPIKQFSCEVCGREFSRHSNLIRHAEIHRGAGTLHLCDICGCSYSFVSSLTRHIVQKHIGQQQ